MDRVNLIEPKGFEPQWRQTKDADYYQNVIWMNSEGTQDPNRLPMRSFVTPRLMMDRQPESVRRLNERVSRYHFPSGLQYNPKARDLYGVNNSSRKVSDFMVQEIRANPGIWRML
jgi:hypothetical protein